MKKSVLLLLLSLPIFNYAQNFELSGDFQGSNTSKIILQYISQDGEKTRDTIKIENGKFNAYGNIQGTQKVLLLGNIRDYSMEDPNLAYFFLEPGKTKIKLEEDNFKKLIIANSPINSEFEKMNKRSLKIISQVDSLTKAKADKNEIIRKIEEIKKFELNYASENRSSILSSYYVHFYMRQLEPNVLKEYYDRMSANNKKTIYGKEIKSLLNIIIVETTDKAPDFNLIDLKGNNINMESFKGKYLLIDFWAGWCVPCVKQLPELKNLSKKFEQVDFEVLGVSFDQNEDLWRKSVLKHGTQDWNHVFVGMKNIRNEGTISEKYDIQPIPAYILIDKEGNIIDRYLNASDDDKDFKDLTLKLEELMAK